jgi:hypothetical protein
MSASKKVRALLYQINTVAEGAQATNKLSYDELASVLHELQVLVNSCLVGAEVSIEACGIESDDL